MRSLILLAGTNGIDPAVNTARRHLRGELAVRFGALFLCYATAVLAAACQSAEPRAESSRSVMGSGIPEHVSFSTTDGGLIHADVYGAGERGVVLAHGGRFDKSSWEAQARVLVQAGFCVLAFDFRGYGESRGGSPGGDPYADLHLDVLAAVRALHDRGAGSVSIIGGSMGGWAAAQAAVAAAPGEIERLVLLSHGDFGEPERLRGRKLFVTTRDDPYADGSMRLGTILDQYERSPEPKELVVLDGSAHAQHIFGTEQAVELLDEILRFLSSP